MSHVAYLAPGLGTLSGTFVYREIRALREAQVAVSTFGTTRPRDAAVSDEARPIIETTEYLYDLPVLRVLSGSMIASGRFPRRFLRTSALALRDAMLAEVPHARDRMKLVWHLLVGATLANQLSEREVEHLHAHFAHVPAAIAMYAASIAGIPFSFTCHANDIFERPTALREKVQRSAFTASISEYNRRHLVARGCSAVRIELVRCGIDLEEFPVRQARPLGTPVRVLCVGRLVEKKGIEYLVDAARILANRGAEVQVDVVGEGPLYGALAEKVQRLGVERRVALLGGLPNEDVKRRLYEADLFVLPCVVARSGDQDGIPVSLMEAMAAGVPVVSTPVSGIPELIQDGESGVLVPPRDAEGLAEGIERMISRPELTRRVATTARRTIEEHFDQRKIAASLRTLFERSIAKHRAHSCGVSAPKDAEHSIRRAGSSGTSEPYAAAPETSPGHDASSTLT